MLLPRTLRLESATIHDGVINAVVDSDNPVKDFRLPAVERLELITDNDNLLTLVDIDLNHDQVESYAVSPRGRYAYQLSVFEQMQILKETRRFYERTLQDTSAA